MADFTMRPLLSNDLNKIGPWPYLVNVVIHYPCPFDCKSDDNLQSYDYLVTVGCGLVGMFLVLVGQQTLFIML